MPTPTLPIATLSTANTFRAWLERTNNVIDLINSGTLLVGDSANGKPIGAFSIGNTSETTSSLTIAGGKFFANATGITLTGTSVFGANVTVNTSSANVVFSSNATYLVSNTTFVGGVNLYVNTATTINGSLTLAGTTSLTVSGVSTFAANATFSANLVASNTVYARSIVFNRSDSVVADTISSAQYNNYTTTGLDDAIVLNLNPDTVDVSVTGITAPGNMSAGARILYVQNTNASYKVSLRHANTSSSASNRFSLPNGTDIDILPLASIPLIYSFTTSRWRPLAGASDTSTQSLLTVSGNASIGGQLTVTGNTTLNGNTAMSSNVAVDTNVLFVDTVNNRVGINSATPDRALQVVGAASVSGAANLLSTLGVTLASTLANTLAVTGATTLSNTLSVTGASNVLSTFGITGAANALSTLGISGAANALSTLGITGATNALSTLGITGAVNALSTLGVTGATTLGSTLLVNGISTMNANVTITNGSVLTTTSVTESVIALGTVGASATISVANGTTITATLTASTTTTFTLPTPGAGKSFTIYVTQVGSGTAGNAAWSTPSGSVKWPQQGSAPTISTTNSRVDIFSFVSNGTNWYGSYIQNY